MTCELDECERGAVTLSASKEGRRLRVCFEHMHMFVRALGWRLEPLRAEEPVCPT